MKYFNNPHTLEELKKLCTEPLTKSGINHRFSKIIEISDKITKDKFKITTL